jgi:glycosyltransferase involved in cell wall biosynthesis
VHVLIYEQQHAGHFYQCVQPLLRPLLGMASRVTLAVTEKGVASTEFGEHLTPTLRELGNRVTVAPVIPPARPGMRWADRPHELRVLRGVLGELRPDYVLCPTGDVQTSGMALWTLTGRRALPRGIRGEAAMHTGAGHVYSARHWAKRAVFTTTHVLSAWDRVHFINPFAYDMLRRGPLLRGRAAALPYPVWPAPPLGTTEARRRLGLPEDGRLIVATGFLDGRKAVGELMDAFASATRADNDRLLLAGPLDRRYEQVLDTKHAGLLRSGRIIATRRYHLREEFTAAVAAADVVAAPYPDFDGISSVVLVGAAAGKPVLTDHRGWSGEANRRFGLGWAADVRDPGAFSATISRALGECAAYTQGPAVRSLVEWHSPENYTASFLQRLRGITGIKGPEPRRWESVTAAARAC